MNPDRGAMPPPEPMALVVRGHVVRADSAEELISKLRLLGEAIGFSVEVKADGLLTLTFDGDEITWIEGTTECLPN